MRQNILGELYDVLLGLEIMDDNFLKWDGQWLVLMHILAMLIILLRHLLFLTTALKYF